MTIADTDERFGFGSNWLVYLEHLNEDRIAEAEKTVRTLTGLDRLDGKSFIDIGSGSGLLSLAARRLGATVHSFDYDPQSVVATQFVKDRFFPRDASWTIERGSVLDQAYLSKLGTFDIAFSWGVLHHTGAMYDAIRNASKLAKPAGLFIFALYRKTKFCQFWTAEKKWYINASPGAQRIATKFYVLLYRLAFILKGRDFGDYVANYKFERGMEFETNVQDWIGGYPYEFISPDEVANLMATLDFGYVRSVVAPKTLSILGSGCDEYVYRRPLEGLAVCDDAAHGSVG